VPAPIATAVLEGLVAPAAGFEQAVAMLAAALPEDWIDDDRPGRIPCFVGLGAIAFALRRLRRGKLASAAAIWIALAGSGLEPWPAEAGFGASGPELLFLDVGQADAALLQSRTASWLVDTGPGAEDGSGGTALVRALRAEGVRRLDVLVLTHGDLDHRGGALRVLSAVDVGELWLPRLERPDPALERIAGFASGDRRGSADGLEVEVLWPPVPTPGAPPPTPSSGVAGRARNERSLVLSVELAGLRALFMADVGAEVEATLARTRADGLRSDVLKAGHHGSRHSSTDAFLAAVAPQIAIVSAPCLGARGLPSGEALQRLRASGARLGWTGRDGALLVTGRGAGSLAMRYWGAPRRCATGFEREAAQESGSESSMCGENRNGAECDGEP
jgi:competence protein ComEC